MRWGLILAVFVAAGVGLWTVMSLLGGGQVGLLRPADAATVAQGQSLYAANCASCHGADLKGQPDWRSPGPDGLMPAPPHDVNGHTWHHDDETLFRLTKLGPAAVVGGGYESAMPAYAEMLSDEEIVAVLSYIKSTWPEEIRTRHDSLNAAREESK
ncbi:c-type cytochrome [Aurantimonas marina]|uniref:c-type cytochrome n=1 Tax=Aurantimonas marina TaxID=2780508 RepID=UPI0019D0CF1E|nr:cytochrome c [Aurantimonas marina]